ncbi:aquaporin NIP1-1-like [Aristolochia californica]|uniref:aquaporin NIP1-1-like n=1 Tax=Aristolochia californica TaxID=171875 RepID=UPI0035D74B66
MAEISSTNGNHVRFVEDGVGDNMKAETVVHVERGNSLEIKRGSNSMMSVSFLQKLIAEVFGTYFVIFAGCAAVVVNLSKGSVTFPGICIVWGLVVMVMVYSVGHISGAHFNPAVSIAFATCGRFPWTQVPAYIFAQLLGSTLASGTLRLLFGGKHEHFPGTIPVGSDLQSLILEFIISFYLMFVISGVATDNRAIGELAGLAVGATILLNVLIAGPISGASMNPARSLGPAIVGNRYESIWVYLVGPTCGTICGTWAYNLIRFTNKPLREITKSGSFLRSSGRNSSG